MILQSKNGGDYTPHPEGIHAAMCCDCIDLGLQQSTFNGETKLVNKLRLVFETEEKLPDGRNCTISKTFTASLHPKARLAEFIGKWRGKPVLPGETVDLDKLVGASCTLVISHQENMVGRKFANIDAVSKPTKKLAPSGHYDPAAARQRIAEWAAKQSGQQQPQQRLPVQSHQQAAPTMRQPAPAPAHKPVAPATSPASDFDPEVGF